MKSRTLTCVTAIAFATLAVSVQLSGQERDDKPKHHHYKLIDLGTFGGPSSYLSALFDGGFFGSANVMNKNDTFAGWADTPTKDSLPPPFWSRPPKAVLRPELVFQESIDRRISCVRQGICRAGSGFSLLQASSARVQRFAQASHPPPGGA